MAFSIIMAFIMVYNIFNIFNFIFLYLILPYYEAKVIYVFSYILLHTLIFSFYYVLYLTLHLKRITHIIKVFSHTVMALNNTSQAIKHTHYWAVNNAQIMRLTATMKFGNIQNIVAVSS